MRLLLGLALALVPPVPGAVVRPFAYGPDPFRGGQHRGVDLAADRGAPVRAPCTGVVVHVGRVPAGPGVSLRCGRWRVSVLGVVAGGVAEGARVGAGTAIGRATAVRGHQGVHLGVRPLGDRFGYVDPSARCGRRRRRSRSRRGRPRTCGARG